MTHDRAEIEAEQYHRVLRFVRRRTRSPDEAEEVAQEVFLDMASTLATSAKAAPETLGWLYTVARRRAADEARRKARSLTVSLELAEAPAAQADAYGGDVARALDAALTRLPEGQRQVVLGRLIQGRSFAEIASDLGLTQEACRMRFMRGLRELRSEFEKEGLTP